MSQNRLIALSLALLSARAFAEEASWTLAAEAFKTIRVPEVYAGIETSIPPLILAKLGSVNERMIFPDERKSRALAELSAERVKLVTERASLVFERDKTFMSDKGTLRKAKMRSDAQKKIIAKEKEIKKLDEKIKTALAEPYEGTSSRSVDLWESGSSLFERKEGESLAKSLLDAKASALVTGTIEDLAGYLLVTAKIDTGIPGIPAISVTEAAPYEELDALVSTIALRLLPELSRTAPVSINIKVNPENAVVFVDERQVYDTAAPIMMYSGEHTLTVNCDGYRAAVRTYEFSGAAAFDVDITLVREPTVSVAFDATADPSSLYFHTQPLGETPLVADLPSIRTIGEADNGEIKTFFVFDPGMEAAGSSIDSQIRSNKISTKLRIERTRTWFYWSLGALYLSLPVYMISNDVAREKYDAYIAGKIAQTQKNVDDINGLIRFSTNAGYVSLGLGVNVAFQLFRYILASEQAIPKMTVNSSSENGER